MKGVKVAVSELKIGQTVQLPHVTGWRVITFVKKSRRYKGFTDIQWKRLHQDNASQVTLRATDQVEVLTERPIIAHMSDDALLKYLGEQDPDCVHDDLHEPDGELAEYWRAAGNRGLLNM